MIPLKKYFLILSVLHFTFAHPVNPENSNESSTIAGTLTAEKNIAAELPNIFSSPDGYPSTFATESTDNTTPGTNTYASSLSAVTETVYASTGPQVQSSSSSFPTELASTLTPTPTNDYTVSTSPTETPNKSFSTEEYDSSPTLTAEPTNTPNPAVYASSPTTENEYNQPDVPVTSSSSVVSETVSTSMSPEVRSSSLSIPAELASPLILPITEDYISTSPTETPNTSFSPAEYTSSLPANTTEPTNTPNPEEYPSSQTTVDKSNPLVFPTASSLSTFAETVYTSPSPEVHSSTSSVAAESAITLIPTTEKDYVSTSPTETPNSSFTTGEYASSLSTDTVQPPNKPNSEEYSSSPTTAGESDPPAVPTDSLPPRNSDTPFPSKDVTSTSAVANKIPDVATETSSNSVEYPTPTPNVVIIPNTPSTSKGFTLTPANTNKIIPYTPTETSRNPVKHHPSQSTSITTNPVYRPPIYTKNTHSPTTAKRLPYFTTPSYNIPSNTASSVIYFNPLLCQEYAPRCYYCNTTDAVYIFCM